MSESRSVPMLLSATLVVAIMAPLVAGGVEPVQAQNQRPPEGFRIIGNIYWVGGEYGSYLITTPQGHILHDTGTNEMHDVIVSNVKKLGFDVKDIKMIISSHAHFDHVQGHAAMKKLTGAQVIALGGDAAALEAGQDNSAGGFRGMVAVHVDRVIKDGDTIALGGVTLRALWVPGHTQGATVWMGTVSEGGKNYSVAFRGGETPNEGVQLIGNPRHPNVIEDTKMTLQRLKALQPPDLFLHNHRQNLGRPLNPALPVNPLCVTCMDAEAFKAMVANAEKSFAERVRKAGAHWPRFRGPGSNPVSDDPNLPLTWSETENVEWVTDLPGVGWSSPVVWGRHVFLTAATSDQPMKQPALGVDYSNEYLAELRKLGLSAEEINKRLYQRDREMPDDIVIRLMLYCHDLETGKKLWERELYQGRPAGGRHSKNSFASETPTTDGDRVYVYLTDYGLFAYDFTGKQVWTTPLKRHETTRDWGTGASPALHNDRLFILNDNEEQSFVAAFDTRTGKELWRTPRTVQPARKTGWSTPFVWENRVRTELVTLGPGVAISYSLDGRELWRLNRLGGVAIQSPFAWNDLLFITSGSGADDNKPVVAVRAGGSGDITPPADETRNEHVVWYDRRAGGTYLPTPVLYRDALYVLNDKGIFSRHDAQTGERTYQARVAPGAATFTASPWAYNGHIFALSEEGDTFVVEAADQYRLVRVNPLGDFSMATPAIVGDRLLIRTQHRLYSIRQRK